MASQKQIEANRRNALKSTGPKTAEGKAVVRLNALRHGVTAETAVIPFVENPEDWEAHLEGVIESLAPSGHLETVLTERVAMLLWRLGRANRYERELVAVEQETLEEKHFRYTDGPKSLEQMYDKVKEYRRLRRLINNLPTMKKKEALATSDAVWILDKAEEATENTNFEYVSLPEVIEDLDFEAFDGWTAGILKEAITALAEEEGKTFEELLEIVRIKAGNEESKAKVALEKAIAAIEQKRRVSLLPNAGLLVTLSRYEAHLERSLYKTLREIERLQSLCESEEVSPPVDVEVTVDEP